MYFLNLHLKVNFSVMILDRFCFWLRDFCFSKPINGKKNEVQLSLCKNFWLHHSLSKFQRLRIKKEQGIWQVNFALWEFAALFLSGKVTWKNCTVPPLSNSLSFFFKDTKSFLIIIYLFIYFWLCWVFVSVRGLSPLQQAGATPHRGARASHYRGLSRCGAQAQ